MPTYNIPTGDFETSNLIGAMNATSSSTTVGAGLSIAATNGVMHVDYSSVLSTGVDNGPETVTYASYNTSTGAMTGIVRGAAATFGSGGAGTGVAHQNNAPVAFGPSVLMLQGLQDGTEWSSTAITLGYAETAVDQTPVTAETDVTGLSVSVTIPAGWTRRIRVTGHVTVGSTTSGAIINSKIFKDGSQVAAVQFAASNGTNAFTLPDVSYTEVPAAGSHTYKIRALCNAGTGTVTSSFSKSYVLVEAL